MGGWVGRGGRRKADVVEEIISHKIIGSKCSLDVKVITFLPSVNIY